MNMVAESCLCIIYAHDYGFVTIVIVVYSYFIMLLKLTVNFGVDMSIFLLGCFILIICFSIYLFGFVVKNTLLLDSRCYKEIIGLYPKRYCCCQLS